MKDSVVELLAGVRALVVDDHEDACELVAAILRGAGATVEKAYSAKEALEKLKSQSPDVLLSDIGMPELTGFDLMRMVRALPVHEGGKTPAAAISAWTRPEDQQLAIDCGFQHFVGKPLTAKAVREVVALLLGRGP